MQDRPVLLVSDRPDRAGRLARGIALIMPCRLVEAQASLPAVKPLAWIVDLDLDRAAETPWFERLCARIEPASACIYLARDAGARDPAALERLGPTTIVPPKLHANGIISTLVQAIDRARLRAAQAPTERSLARATDHIGNVFVAASIGRAPSAAEADDGTRIVLDAISEIGIRDWLETIWRHDVGVYQHSLSVAGCAAAFAAELGFSRADRYLLAKAALLHDVGKARIPLAILNKPGPLTAEEMAVMKTHAAIGADILAAAGHFEPEVVAVARQHHERLDGSGYPDGATGEAICDLARLVAICDVHSAMTERRVYRAPMPVAKARALMEGMAGQLDADLLRAYRPILDQCESAGASA